MKQIVTLHSGFRNTHFHFANTSEEKYFFEWWHALDYLHHLGVKKSVYPYDRIVSAFRHSIGEISALDIPESTLDPMNAAQLDQVAHVAKSTRNHLDEALTNVMRIFHNIAPERSTEEREMDSCATSVAYSANIGVHVLLNQYLHTWALANESQKNTTMDYEEERPDLDPNIVTKHNILSIVEASISDAKALCTEKLGEVPDFKIVQPDASHWQVSSLCVSSHLHFMLVELLKNSAKASFENTMRSFEGLNVDTIPPLPPVTISAAVSGPYWSLKISDQGGGMDYETEEKCMRWFGSAMREQKTPTYTYGGDFGPQLSGLGVGLPASRLYCRFMGGDLRLLTHYGAGTDVVLHWNRFGTSTVPPCQ